MHNTYKISILYFLLFTLLLITSAVMLFEQKIGFSFKDVVAYYVGDELNFIPAKTNIGTLKIILPHIFSFGLIIMVLTHFLIFTKERRKKSTIVLIYLIFISAFLELFTPFFIINGFYFFAYLKILSFFLFLGLIVYVEWLIFYSIVKE